MAPSEPKGRLHAPMDMGHIIDRSLALYRRNFTEFVAIAAITLPADLANVLVASFVDDRFVATVVAVAIIAVGVFLTILATAAIATAIGDVATGATPDFNRAYAHVFARLGGLLSAAVRMTATLLLLAVTIVGLPVAIWLGIRWALFPQTFAMEGQTGSGALSRSSELVEGSWWRVFSILVIVSLLGSLPTLAVSALLGAAAPVGAALASSVVAVLVLPFVAGASTLLYFDQRGREAARRESYAGIEGSGSQPE